MQLVRRALAVLTELADADQPPTLQELSDTLAIPPASMHRILATLTEEGFAVRDSHRRYALGRAALSLAGDRRNLADVARPLMRQMVSQTGETVFVAEMAGRRALCTGIMDGTHALRLYVRAGQELPLNASAAARVLLSGFDRRRQAALLHASPIVFYTDRTPVQVEAILQRVDAIRVRGYETCDDELDSDVWAVAAPVNIGGQRAAGAIASAVPAARLTDARKRTLIEQVTRAGQALSQRMGGEVLAVS